MSLLSNYKMNSKRFFSSFKKKKYMPKTGYLTKKDFLEKYMNFKDLNFIFKKARIILRSKKNDPYKVITKKNKQRRIEKLFNMFLLTKIEKTYKINPFWVYKINSLFSDDYKEFVNYSSYLFENVHPILRSYLYLQELIVLTIYSFLELSTRNNDFSILTATFRDHLSNLFVSFFSNVSELYSLYLYLTNLDFNLFLENYSSFCTKERKSDFFKENFDLKNAFLNLKNINLVQFEKNIINQYKSNKKDFVMTYEIFLLEFLKKISLKVTSRGSLFKYIKQDFLLFYKKEKSNIFSQFSEISWKILELFNKKKIFRSISGRIGKKVYDYASFYDLEKFSKLKSTFIMLSQIPMICPPKDWDINGQGGGYLLNFKTSSLTKSLSQGVSEAQHSSFFINSINLIQNKKYTINQQYLQYLDSESFFLENDILNMDQIYYLYIDYMNLKNNSSVDHPLIKKEDFGSYFLERNSLLSNKKYKFYDEEKKKELQDNFMSLFSLETSSYSNIFELDLLKKKILKYIGKYANYYFIREVAHLLKYEILFIPTQSDFRGRMVPLGRLNRASGIYKYLLVDFEISLSNSRGGVFYDAFVSTNFFTRFNKVPSALLFLKEAIVVHSSVFNSYGYTKKELLQYFDNYLSTHFTKDFFIDLCKFLTYKENYTFLKDLTKVKSNPIYSLILKSKNRTIFSFLLYNYFCVTNFEVYNFYCDFDHCSSGPMINSMLCYDRSIAFLTNAISKDFFKKKDLYTHFLMNLKTEIQNNQSLKDTFFIQCKKKELFESIFDRSLSKLIVMPTFYNMGSKGINKKIIELSSSHSFFSNSHTRKKLQLLIISLLKKLYTYSLRFQKYLSAIAKILQKKSQQIRIKTLDGTIFSYKYIEPQVVYRRARSLKSKGNSFVTYKIYLPLMFSSKNILSHKHIISFPPNYIHSLDGAICRLVHSIFFKLTGYNLEPLHDSYRLPFEYCDILTYCVKYVFLFYFFNDYFHRNQVGLTKKNPRGTALVILEKYSESYRDYNLYFPYEYSGDLLSYTFYEPTMATLDETTCSILRKKISSFKKAPSFTDNELDLFLKSDFLYYF